MFQYQGEGLLSANGDSISIPVPQDGVSYHLVVLLEALSAWTGTVQLTDDGSAVLANTVSSVAAAAHPTAAGEYSIDAAGAAEVGVTVSAYTAGQLRARLALVAQA